MIINTKAFGELDIEEDKIINFNNGLPGFPEDKRFVIISEDQGDGINDNMFYWMQSVDDTETAFALLNTMNIIEDYSPIIDKDELGELKDSKEEELLVYNIVVVPQDPNKMTVNLKAPVLINQKNKIGKQVIACNDDYHIRHQIVDEIRFRSKK